MLTRAVLQWLAVVWVVCLIIFSLQPRRPEGTRGRGVPLHQIEHVLIFGATAVLIVALGRSRREELQAANESWVGVGGFTYLITLTFPHEADWLLKDLMRDFDTARMKFRNSSTWKNIFGKERAAGLSEQYPVSKSRMA